MSYGPRNEILPGHQSHLLQGCPLCGQQLPFCGSVATNAVDVTVDRAGSWPGWLYGTGVTATDMLVGTTRVLLAARLVEVQGCGEFSAGHTLFALVV